MRVRKLHLFLVICCLGATAFSGLVVREYISYRRDVPPVTRPEVGDCETSGLVAHWKLICSELFSLSSASTW